MLYIVITQKSDNPCEKKLKVRFSPKTHRKTRNHQTMNSTPNQTHDPIVRRLMAVELAEDHYAQHEYFTERHEQVCNVPREEMSDYLLELHWEQRERVMKYLRFLEKRWVTFEKKTDPRYMITPAPVQYDGYDTDTINPFQQRRFLAIIPKHSYLLETTFDPFKLGLTTEILHHGLLRMFPDQTHHLRLVVEYNEFMTIYYIRLIKICWEDEADLDVVSEVHVISLQATKNKLLIYWYYVLICFYLEWKRSPTAFPPSKQWRQYMWKFIHLLHHLLCSVLSEKNVIIIVSYLIPPPAPTFCVMRPDVPSSHITPSASGTLSLPNRVVEMFREDEM